MIDVVEVVARKIIGSEELHVGIHSTSIKRNKFIGACYSIVQMAKASEWLTETDFYIGSYAFVVWQKQTNKLAEMKLDEIPKSASENYECKPLDYLFVQ